MLGLQLKRVLGAVAAIAGIAGVLAGIVVLTAASFVDPRFSLVGFEVLYDGRPFTGLAYELHSNGSVYRLVPVWNGSRIWKEIHWYENGARWAELDYSNGVPHGRFRFWHPGGEPMSVQEFADGVEHGEFWSWNPKGSVVEYRLTERGNEVAYKAFTFDQKVFYNYVNRNGERVGVQAGQFCKSKKKSPN